MRPIPTAVLISGRGSNMAALIEAAKAPDYPAEIRLVISNEPQAAGLAHAAAAGVQTLAADHRLHGKDRAAHEAVIDAALRAQGVELIALAGYMRILTPFFIARWRGRMINIHPSLLPRHPGLHTHARALAAGESEAGCTVHLVTEGVDEGPILGQRTVPILPDDDEQSLAQRVLSAEHALYPECLAALARRLQDEEASGRG